MNVTISLPDDVAAKLRERAIAQGQDIPVYASQLVEQAIKSPTIDEILAPVRKDFAESGMTEAQIMELGRRELDALRAEKKAKAG